MRKENYASIKWAKIESPPIEDMTRIWNGIYQGVHFEIKRLEPFLPGSKEFRWVHYLIIPIDDQIESELVREKLWLHSELRTGIGKPYIHHDYDSIDIDFHGGITFYDKISGLAEGTPRIVKIGCDYMHMWDEGRDYSLEDIYSEVKKSVESFIKFCGGRIKIRSFGDGVYRFIEEFEKE